MKTKYFLLNQMSRGFFAFVMVATLMVTHRAQAAGGTLDPAFGTNGTVVTDLGSPADAGINLILQPDGKIIMAGSAQKTPVLIRYNANGSPDLSFGVNGILTVNIAGFTACKADRQVDGKLIVAGTQNSGFAVARYDDTGTQLDSAFGVNGLATASFPNYVFWCSDLAIQPDGKIVVFGTEQTATSNFLDYVIARFNEDGTLDEDFRIFILDRTNFPNSRYNYGQAVAIQADGRIVMSGNMVDDDAEGQISLARLSTDTERSPDASTFGTNGKGTVTSPLANFTQGSGALALQADGKIVLAGTTYSDFHNPDENVALIRFRDNGTLDPTFGGSGIVITDLGKNEQGSDLAIQSDGKIIVVGKSDGGNSSDFLLLRYNRDGALDTTFGTNGTVISDFGNSLDSARGAAIQTDGKILATGAKDGDAILARYDVSTSSAPTTTAVFKSKGAEDGWILESAENSGVGRSLNKTATTFNVGDDRKDRQYRSILSFNTASLPDVAIIISAQLNIQRQGVVGTDPFTTHGNLLLDIRNGMFSQNLALKKSDFSAAPALGSVKDIFSPLTFSWYTSNLSTTNLSFVNKVGVTQFRLRCSLDDNDNLKSDYMKFYSGNAPTANQPQLIITYTLPQ